MNALTDGFGVIDFVVCFFWLTLFVIFGAFHYQKNKQKIHYTYYWWNFSIKMFSATAYALVHIYYFQGGDTLWFWYGSSCFVDVFTTSPIDYFYALFDLDTSTYTQEIGKLQALKQEPETYFVCKVYSIISLISFKSYYAGSLISGYISSLITWKFFEFIQNKKLGSTKFLAIAILFIPTVNFWCVGISKDSIILNSIFLLVISLNHLFNLSSKIKSFLIVLVTSFLIFKVRSFILVATLPSLMATIFSVISLKLSSRGLARTIFRFTFITFVLVLGGYYFISGSGFGSLSFTSLIDQMRIIQDDFAKNLTYTGVRYDIGIVDYTPLSMLSNAPAAIGASLYRPYLWESSGRNPFMILNGIEGFIMLILTLNFIFRKKLKDRFFKIFKNDILLFSFFFVIIIGFFVGFSSVIFGVLVRLKAPILPFFVLLLNPESTTKMRSSNIISEKSSLN